MTDKDSDVVGRTRRAAELGGLVGRAEAAAAGGVKAQLQWLEEAASAIDAARLGDEGTAAATDLRAALGAIAHWARGKRDASTLPELEAVVRTFTVRGLVTLYGALSEQLAELASHRPEGRVACLELSAIFAGLRGAQHSGAPPPAGLLERLEAARRELETHPEKKER